MEVSPDGEPTHDPNGPRATSTGRRGREAQAGASPAARGLHRAQRGGTSLFRWLVGCWADVERPWPTHPCASFGWLGWSVLPGQRRRSVKSRMSSTLGWSFMHLAWKTLEDR